MLKMTDEQRYSAVLKELGEVLQEKNTTICCLRWQVDELKEKLAKAEKECADQLQHIYKLNDELVAALTETDSRKEMKHNA